MAGVVVVVAILVVAGLYVLHMPPFPKPSPPSPPSPTSVVASPNVTVLSNATMADLISNGSGFYNFTSIAPGISSLHPGSIILTAAGSGLLARVVTITNRSNMISLFTVPSSLSQVFLQGEISSEGPLVASSPSSSIASPGSAVADRGSSVLASFSFTQTWATGDGGKLAVSGSDTISGSYALFANFSLLQGLTGFYFGTQLSNVLSISASVTQAASVSVSAPVYHTILSDILIQVGPIPLVLVPVLNFTVGASLNVKASVTASFSGNAAASTGVRYAQGAWSPFVSQSMNWTYSAPVPTASISERDYALVPHLDLLVDGLVGPTLALQPYLRLSGTVPGCPAVSIFAGITGAVGIDLGFLSLGLAKGGSELTYPLPSFERKLGSIPSCYGATFDESGLPTGTAWSVSLNTTARGSTSPRISFENLSNGSYNFAVAPVGGYFASPSSGSLNVSGAYVTQSISFSNSHNDSVSFVESGLQPGTSWSVTMNGVTVSSDSQVVNFTLPNGTYSYVIPALTSMTSTPAFGSLTVEGIGLVEPVNFSQNPKGAYTLMFIESGLPTGAMWTVSATSGAARFSVTDDGGAIELSLPNATYNWSVSTTRNFSQPADLSSDPASGTAVVQGYGGTVNVSFSNTPTYAVTFVNKGLPSGAEWSAYVFGNVTLVVTGQSSASQTRYLANGTYTCGTAMAEYVAGGAALNDYQSGCGLFRVTGKPVTVQLNWSPTVTQNITFQETGLPAGMTWTLTDGGVSVSTGSSSVLFFVSLGDYEFVVGNVPGYRASPTSGNVGYSTFPSPPIMVNITFSKLTYYSLQFVEGSLPAGTNWSVSVFPEGGVGVSADGSSTSTSVTLGLPNGTYVWVASASFGYVESNSSGVITVNGGSQSISLVFTPTSGYRLVEFIGVLGGPEFSITLDGVTRSTNGPFLFFVVPGGSFEYSISTMSAGIAIPVTGVLWLDSYALIYVGFLG